MIKPINVSVIRANVLEGVDALRDRDVCGNNVEKRNESLDELVVARRNLSKRFDSVDEFPHPISPFIGCFVIIENIDTIFLWRNGSLHRVVFNLFSEFIAIVPFMYYHVLNTWSQELISLP
jgi:hypothetical protein